MITAVDRHELRRTIDAWRHRPDGEGDRVGFVPTMGALHDGHLSLVRRAGELADRVVVSVFVNPTQFDEAADLEAYPRDPERDARLLDQAGCDLLFLPSEEVLYPPGDATRVVPGGAAQGLEGEHRGAGHFRGVATVVLKLFNLVRPDLALFGEKDAQQLAVVRQMVRDLFVPVEIVAGETVREEDGLAMSSRNVRLDTAQRRAARVLSRALEAARARFEEGERDAEALRAGMRETLSREPAVEVEYAEVVDPSTFRPLDRIEGEAVLPVAVRLGETRLIDNIRLGAG